MVMRALPFTTRSSSPHSNVKANAEERLRKLPTALQPIFLRCKRVLTDDEWNLLALVTPEQRCAALGMQLEGQHVNSIIAYLLHATEATRKAMTQRQIASSHASTTGMESSSRCGGSTPSGAHHRANPASVKRESSPRGRDVTASPLPMSPKPFENSPAGGQRPMVPSTIASRLKLAMAPPVLLRQAAQRQSVTSPRAGSRSPSGGAAHRSGVSPPPHLKNIAMPRRGTSPGGNARLTNVDGSRLPSPGARRAISPIEPPRYASGLKDAARMSPRTERALFRQEMDRPELRRPDEPNEGRETSYDVTRSPLRSHSLTNMLSRKESTTSSIAAVSPRDDGRRRDYHHAVKSCSPGPRGSHSPTLAAALALVRNGSTQSSVGSHGAPPLRCDAPALDAPLSQRLSPGRASRWQSDFTMKLRDVGLDIPSWCALSSLEHEEFFNYWRMSQLQIAMVKTTYPPTAK